MITPNKMIEDHNAIMDCIRNKGNLKQLLTDRNIKLTAPINTNTHGKDSQQ